ncbi:hypothetical protein Fot_13712 [Forsythia ovata]|uniref:Uncharacterized protein n=1 Tax=Forsythia ovata TaxID=205694 RepID=A0ABD1W4A5_9LAMI
MFKKSFEGAPKTSTTLEVLGCVPTTWTLESKRQPHGSKCEENCHVVCLIFGNACEMLLPGTLPSTSYKSNPLGPLGRIGIKSEEQANIGSKKIGPKIRPLNRLLQHGIEPSVKDYLWNHSQSDHLSI